jgi:hypothetical protein
MRGFFLALIVAGFGMGQAAGAESASEAIAAFGLVGSWSIDCSKTPTQIAAKDGFTVSPPPTTRPNEIPATWVTSDKPTPLFERCSD